MPKPEPGQKAPEIALLDDAGQPFKLSDLHGKKIVLYFYPKADTPGCTKEACAFRDDTPKLDAANTVVVGVSPDKPGSQAKFKQKFGLPFTLLADTEHQVAEAYGVWVEKSMYGKKYMGVERATFLIGPDGVIRKVFPKVKVEGHSDEVLSALNEM